MMKKILLAAIAMAGSISAFSQQADLIIRNTKVIDVRTGEIKSGQSIIVRHDTIIAVTNDSKANKFKASETYNAAGKYAMPGLWDMHMHFGGGDTLANENKNFLPLYLAHGITTVRDCSADISDLVIKWRGEVNNGTLQGPTIFTSGPKLEGYKSIWLNDLEIGTSEELQKALDSLQRIKVDFIKVTDNTLKNDLYLEALREARKRGWAVSAHIPYTLTMDQVTAAGLSAVEHLGYAWKAGVKDEAALSQMIAKGELKGRDINKYIMSHFDTAAAMKTYRMMAARGTAVTPTLTLPHLLAYLDQDDHKHDPYLQYIGKGIQGTYAWRVNRTMQDDSAAIAWRKEVFAKTAAILPLLEKAGVKLMAGTDAGYLNSYDYPGIGLHQELALMVQFGHITPLQALQASVINSPEFLHKTNYGAIAPGKKADILLLNANPLDDITNTQKINAVVVKGKLLNRQALDGLLQQVSNSNK
ncbi:imidazolonepropionase-like amidohydrolase [Chitinophaga dinghuensis]|uniref:Imidazolonepropionase-like amidohydrolase n=1 Tax=Chitinophaga dinghuensis TaxID=1539050 RepID=A0A327WBK7_9BACT|nr:amidohydrolase family protein [Chitinophaga dinghuensis]RAJ87905.1 imidazolonepropionase-like amidohydrolase [Chitinophaga dinghuensis]